MTLPALPLQPAGTPWPTEDWPRSDLSAAAQARLAPLLREAFAGKASPLLGETHALVVVQGGRIVVERYGEGKAAADTLPSWSMAKSITHALVGILVGDGLIDIHAPADAPEWRAPGDPRAGITLDQLLRMSSGLRFVEDYSPENPSDVIAMLFGEGEADVAGFAARFPLEHPPGAFMSYSSGTTNIVARCAQRALGATGEAFKDFMFRRLFDPLGMRTPHPRFDAAGTFIGSSFCYCTAQDFARFGLLYLRDGVWDGVRILPEGWVDYARTPTWRQPGCADGPYGAHWWLGVGGPGSFSANGYDGQYILLLPQDDLILVRLGARPVELKENVVDWMNGVIEAVRA